MSLPLPVQDIEAEREERDIGKIKLRFKAHSIDVVVNNKQGIHARPSAEIVKLSNTYEREIFIEKLFDPECHELDGKKHNCKSIMDLISVFSAKGARLRLYVQRLPKDDSERDEYCEEACYEMKKMLESDFENAYD